MGWQVRRADPAAGDLLKRVVVTGATGFIGRACLAPLLARGFEVHAIHHARPGEAAGVTWHHADLLAEDGSTVIRDIAPTHLLHLAWYAVPGKYWTSRENLRWVRASLAIYEDFVAAGGQRLVMGGTAAEYDWTRNSPCRENDTPLTPRTYYGACKRALGEVIAADTKVVKISAAWARFFMLYGPHEYRQRLIAAVITTLLRGEVVRCSPGTQWRDFLYVDDAAHATVALLDGTVEGPVNIASGAAVTVRSIVEKVAELIGGTGSVEFGALPPDDPTMLVADVRRLTEEVGFAPVRGSEDRLRETIAWWRENLAS